MSIYSKTAAGWVEVAGGSSKAALSSWGRVVGEPEGAVTSTYFKNDDGSQWQYWEFNQAGDYEIDLGNGGLFWCLVVGGGGQGAQASTSYGDQGQAGLVREGLWEFGPGTHPVTVGKQGTLGSGGPTSEQPVEKQGQPSHIGDRLTGFSTQASVSWGSRLHGRGTLEQNDQRGYHSSITGEDSEYAPGYLGPEVPGRAGYNGSSSTDGVVIIATRIDVEQLAPAPAELAPAPVLGAPVKVSGTADVVEYIVRQTDGSRKKIYMLPGNTGDARPANSPENVFEVALGAGTLNAVMIGGGGAGGSSAGATYAVSGGGAGGVVGTGAHIPIILPIQGEATYTIKVASTTFVNTTFNGDNYSQDTTIQVKDQPYPFLSAVGGGAGIRMGSTNTAYGSRGGSGGGGNNQLGTAGTSAKNAEASPGVAGQGMEGNWHGDSGGGGGYSEGGVESKNGGAGFDLATALSLDGNDSATAAFLAAVTEDGFIAGGGAGRNGTATAGGGQFNNGADGMAYTGAGGFAGSGRQGGKGGCGAVYIITDV